MLERICGDLKIICCATKTVRVLEALRKAVCLAAIIFALVECIIFVKGSLCRD